MEMTLKILIGIIGVELFDMTDKKYKIAEKTIDKLNINTKLNGYILAVIIFCIGFVISLGIDTFDSSPKLVTNIASGIILGISVAFTHEVALKTKGIVK